MKKILKGMLKESIAVTALIVIMGVIYKFEGIEEVAIFASACIIYELWQISTKL